MGDPTPPATRPTRRLVGAGALGALVGVLTGCGIRLEDDAPRVPLVPTREPIPAEAALLRLLGAVQAAALAPADATAPLSPVLAALHTRQAEVLRDALRQRGVPQDALPSSMPSPTATPTPSVSASVPTPTGTGSPSPSASPSPTVPRTVVAVEGSIVSAADGCAAAETELRPPVLALLAQAHAATELATGSRADRPDPAPPWSRPELLVPLVDATRRAVYLLEVAAARTPGKAQRTAREGIARLDTLTVEVVEAAGAAAPVPDLGYPLPRPVTTPAEAAALATETLATLLAAWGAQLAALTSGDAEAAFADVSRWLGSVAAEAHRGGTPLTAFPGLA
ncbi:DUF4439 domain-containing protein [Knoellia aerolata]|uniref:DUF4439 domain-containing protein n=1 Tax=Knoellia aerolata DSM 18566 TaxID=1385519 RepID=A0A0A0JMM4_9MICO|nr:DUF4439 domain-containing protein [Knoellia aerolata]KGN38388.1 hypothetical protein N801_00080 [Knoellia aerolata DSM 18566]